MHFYSVGFSALVAAAAALGLTIVGARRADTRTMLVGTAFAVMASLLALHGFATPGVWFGNNGVIALTGGATLPGRRADPRALGAAAAARPAERAAVPDRRRRAARSRARDSAFSALVWPSLVPSVPAPNSRAAMALLVVGLLAFGLLALRALRTFLLTRRVLDLVGRRRPRLARDRARARADDGLLAARLVDRPRGRARRDPGHRDRGRDRPRARRAVAAARRRPPRRGARRLRGHCSSARRCARSRCALAEKDEYTERHTRRVALRAVQVGDSSGSRASRLRTLAIGGLVHDIGKLSVPDGILKKPAALDDDEYAAVKEHAERGLPAAERARRLLGGGPPTSCAITTSGSTERGYPRGLYAEEIDLDTRILTVCDVYDALISKRAIRLL